MNSRRITELLTTIGLSDDLLQSAGDDWQLRADLGLSSAETLQLQSLLEKLGCTGFSLWDTHDHSLEELEQLIEATSKTEASDCHSTVNHRGGDQ
jgi:hypothetical protein